jgi:hypothetical protein
MPNELGQRIVANYNASTNKKPGGNCYAVSHSRVNEASQQICHTSLPSLTAFQAFDRLWASKNDPANTWLHLPLAYRGKGAAGAMAQQGRGTIIEQAGIWAGQLLPGAVLQTWRVQADFALVRDGNTPTDIGHSFIFLEYVRTGNTIVGMRIGDQGTGWDDVTLTQDTFGHWVGANIYC